MNKPNYFYSGVSIHFWKWCEYTLLTKKMEDTPTFFFNVGVSCYYFFLIRKKWNKKENSYQNKNKAQSHCLAVDILWPQTNFNLWIQTFLFFFHCAPLTRFFFLHFLGTFSVGLWEVPTHQRSVGNTPTCSWSGTNHTHSLLSHFIPPSCCSTLASTTHLTTSTDLHAPRSDNVNSSLCQLITFPFQTCEKCQKNKQKKTITASTVRDMNFEIKPVESFS